jgi:hypothetical protein
LRPGRARTAAVGDTITAEGSVKNNIDHYLLAAVRLTLTLPGGRSRSVRALVPLAAGQKIAKSVSFVNQSWMPEGMYALRIAATDANGTSHARATVTLV